MQSSISWFTSKKKKCKEKNLPQSTDRRGGGGGKGEEGYGNTITPLPLPPSRLVGNGVFLPNGGIPFSRGVFGEAIKCVL